ncbi:MAG TPA: FkbM family methyltransferase [Thermoleophilaceae bacterium]|nr:FkbM family methyltransferase [Thermoleophilaceae bacterium]
MARALARLPPPVQDILRLGFVAVRVTAGPRSFLTFLHLRSIRRHEGARGRAVRVRLRPLEGREVLLRPSTSDADTVWGTFAGRYHLPPPEVGEPFLIWDLGANVGLTMADLAVRFPAARILGVEIDRENAELARANVQPWSDRCEIVQAGVWPEDGEIRYHRLAGGTSGHHVADVPEGAAGVATAPAISPATLLARSGPGAVVDFAKVDIEGAERELLRTGTEWAARVRAITVEVHEPYSTAQCERDLRALGFTTRVDRRHWACVIGVRTGDAGV